MLIFILSCSKQTFFSLLNQITGFLWIEKGIFSSQSSSFYCTHFTGVTDGTEQGRKGSGWMKEIEISPVSGQTQEKPIPERTGVLDYLPHRHSSTGRRGSKEVSSHIPVPVNDW